MKTFSSNCFLLLLCVLLSVIYIISHQPFLSIIPKYKFQVIDLETFIDALMNGFPNEPIFQKFQHRYLDFRPVELIQSKLEL